MAGHVSRERHDAGDRAGAEEAPDVPSVSEPGTTARSRTSPRARASAQSGWGQGACVGDYDNDGHDDLFVTYWGQNRLYRNRGDGTFEDVTVAAGPDARRDAMGHRLRVPRLRPRRPSRSLRRQLHRLRSGERRRCPSRACAGTRGSRWRAARPGLTGGKNVLYHNKRRRHVRRRVRARGHHRARAAPTVSASARSTSTTTAGSTSTSPTTRIRARSTATTTTARSPTSASRPAAPTARTASRRPAWASRSATTIATARWTSSRRTSPATRRRSTRTPATGLCEDRTFAAGIGLQHALARLGRRVRRSRQRRLARPVPGQRPRLSGGRSS